MPVELLQLIGTQSGAVVIAVIALWFMGKNTEHSEKRSEEMLQRECERTERERGRNEVLIQVIKDNTAALVKLSAVIEQQR